MSDSSEKPWSGDPNAPQISYSLYIQGEGNFVGTSVGAALYGIIIALFFQCMNAMLKPIEGTTGKIKWPFVIHTVAMFSLVTASNVVGLYGQSLCYVDMRDFTGGEKLPPGPVGYLFLLSTKAFGVVPGTFLFLNNWLADGLLLYRCWIIYSRGGWIIAFPCLVYLAFVSMGIGFIHQMTQPDSPTRSPLGPGFGTPWILISLALNLLLTLMIVIQLIRHNRNVKSALGASDGISGVLKAISTMLVESSALFTAISILFTLPFGSSNVFQVTFWPVLNQIQVIAPFLITVRVASRRALTNETIVSGSTGSVRFRGEGESTGGVSVLSSGNPTNSIDVRGVVIGELSGGNETTVSI